MAAVTDIKATDSSVEVDFDGDGVDVTIDRSAIEGVKVSPDGSITFDLEDVQAEAGEAPLSADFDSLPTQNTSPSEGTALDARTLQEIRDLDTSTGNAVERIEQIRAENGKLTAQDMLDLVKHATRDQDGQAAGAEHTALEKYVEDTLLEQQGAMTPAALEVWNEYNNSVNQSKLQNAGADSIAADDWHAMMDRMEEIVTHADITERVEHFTDKEYGLDARTLQEIRDLDTSTGNAVERIEQIRAENGKLTAQDMLDLVKHATRDQDGQAAGAEHTALEKYVEDTLLEQQGAMTPAALEVWNEYNNSVNQSKLQNAGADSIAADDWHAMMDRMEEIVADADITERVENYTDKEYGPVNASELLDAIEQIPGVTIDRSQGMRAVDGFQQIKVEGDLTPEQIGQITAMLQRPVMTDNGVKDIEIGRPRQRRNNRDDEDTTITFALKEKPVAAGADTTQEAGTPEPLDTVLDQQPGQGTSTPDPATIQSRGQRLGWGRLGTVASTLPEVGLPYTNVSGFGTGTGTGPVNQSEFGGSPMGTGVAPGRTASISASPGNNPTAATGPSSDYDQHYETRLAVIGQEINVLSGAGPTDPSLHPNNTGVDQHQLNDTMGQGYVGTNAHFSRQHNKVENFEALINDPMVDARLKNKLLEFPQFVEEIRSEVNADGTRSWEIDVDTTLETELQINMNDGFIDPASPTANAPGENLASVSRNTVDIGRPLPEYDNLDDGMTISVDRYPSEHIDVNQTSEELSRLLSGSDAEHAEAVSMIKELTPEQLAALDASALEQEIKDNLNAPQRGDALVSLHRQDPDQLARVVVDEINTAIGIFTSDEPVVLDLLEGRTEQEMALISEKYQNHPDRDYDTLTQMAERLFEGEDLLDAKYLIGDEVDLNVRREYDDPYADSGPGWQ